MKITIFGLAITSSWGNGHATTYRALCSALHQRGHDITFFEREVEWYASNRDLSKVDFCRVIHYEDWVSTLPQIRRELNTSDVALVGSYFPDGVMAIHEMLNSHAAVRTFYDIDTPITLSQLRTRGAADYLLAEQIPELDLYLSFTGGPALRELESRFGAKQALPFYCSVDPIQYPRTAIESKFKCDLSYMGTYAPDRQPKIEEWLCGPARLLPQQKFIVAGPQYPAEFTWPPNVERHHHLAPRFHPAFYSSSRLTLNLTRRDMVIAGYSPSVRLFEAAACGAAIVSDQWPGLDEFFIPGKEILLPSDTQDVVRFIHDYSAADLRAIGQAARATVMAKHTANRRAQEFEAAVENVKAFRSALAS